MFRDFLEFVFRVETDFEYGVFCGIFGFILSIVSLILFCFAYNFITDLIDMRKEYLESKEKENEEESEVY